MHMYIHTYYSDLVVMAVHQRLLKIVHKGDLLCRHIAQTQQEDKLMGVPDTVSSESAGTFPSLRDVDVQRRSEPEGLPKGGPGSEKMKKKQRIRVS